MNAELIIEIEDSKPLKHIFQGYLKDELETAINNYKKAVIVNLEEKQGKKIKSFKVRKY